MPRRTESDLVVKNGSKIRGITSGAMPGVEILHGDEYVAGGRRRLERQRGRERAGLCGAQNPPGDARSWLLAAVENEVQLDLLEEIF